MLSPLFSLFQSLTLSNIEIVQQITFIPCLCSMAQSLEYRIAHFLLSSLEYPKSFPNTSLNISPSRNTVLDSFSLIFSYSNFPIVVFPAPPHVLLHFPNYTRNNPVPTAFPYRIHTAEYFDTMQYQ